MCGICGFVSEREISRQDLIKMNNTLAHRGPDDHGEEIYQISTGQYVGFAHRRLSIIDLSEKGHQPMHSPDRRVSVVFNGEIYNYRELREKLNGYSFVSNCDTEIIIAAYLQWDIDFVQHLNGMFAIALLDREIGTVYLIRDRIGKKPLYYYKSIDNTIAFASELKAILRLPLFKKEINQSIIGRFLYRQYITAPDTIYCNTYKLEPGAILEIAGGRSKKYKYWDVASMYRTLNGKQVQAYEEAKSELKHLLQESVARRMEADVPLGAFLSGGYDSSLVCAMAQEMSVKPIKTFSIGFYEKKFDEAAYARAVARELGTDHEELYIDENDMLGVIESIPRYYDEPFADSSQIPTMLVSKLAKRKVSVVLSGDGGDELFGGYNIYTILQQVQSRRIRGRVLHEFGRLPCVKQSMLWKNRSRVWRIASDDINSEAKTQSGVNGQFNIISEILSKTPHNFYYEFESRYQTKRYDTIRMLLDMDTYLPEDILAKVDRASMKYSLECRCPILDKEVIEYSFMLPPEYKICRGNKKRILKDIAYDYIPQELLNRPKAGFSIPRDKWLRGVLKERITDWTNAEYLARQGIFEPNATERFIHEYMETGDAGEGTGRNYSGIVWAYFIFQQWYQEYIANCRGDRETMRYEELEELKNNTGERLSENLKSKFESGEQD